MRYAWSALLLFIGFCFIVASIVSMGAVIGSILVVNMADAAAEVDFIAQQDFEKIRNEIVTQPDMILMNLLYAAELTVGTITIACGLQKLTGDK